MHRLSQLAKVREETLPLDDGDGRWSNPNLLRPDSPPRATPFLWNRYQLRDEACLLAERLAGMTLGSSNSMEAMKQAADAVGQM
jgi:hypothetical protein|mmetsp:Transcript_24935/g.45082  ORF Transcript_24935/g.45082 Transcript_24935/m.45082 type:complete len:84 (+) Transcript_24935:313-564(+)